MQNTPFSVGFISQDWSKVGDLIYPNGCTWYRCIIPASILNSAGHSAHIGVAAQTESKKLGIYLSKPLYKTPGIVANHSLLVLKLAMHRNTKNLIEEQIAAGKKVVVDIDDWFDDLPLSNRARDITDPKTNPENNRDIYFEIIEMAHALICSTQFLYDFYSAKHPGKPIFLVRNSIDTGRWVPKQQQAKIPNIGWCGATPWRAHDLEQLSGFFNDFLASRNVKFHHAGHIPSGPSVADLMKIDVSRFSHTPMMPILELPKLLSPIDIGIVPLNNIPFNHAKSYLKGLEYAAAGIPFVASYSPEYQLLADAGVGRIARTENEWTSHLDELMNYKMRQDEAAVNREIVEDQFSMQSHSRQWLQVFSDIMDIDK